MERFGKLVKARKSRVPFEGMQKSQQQSIEDIICHEGQDENKFLIQVIDYKVDDSVIEKDLLGGEGDECWFFLHVCLFMSYTSCLLL